MSKGQYRASGRPYVVMCHSREQAEQAKASLTAWLEPRGLRFNEDKTRIVHVEDGFSFLGFDIRRRVDRQGSGKLLITPSKESVKRFRKRLTADVRSMHGANAAAVVFRLNPVVRGWSAYYRSVVSGRVFTGLDHHVWHLTYRWARRSHPNKSRGWVATRYFGKFHKSRQDRWVFGDRDSGAYLTKFSWTKIVRHVPVLGGASPDHAESMCRCASRLPSALSWSRPASVIPRRFRMPTARSRSAGTRRESRSGLPGCGAGVGGAGAERAPTPARFGRRRDRGGLGGPVTGRRALGGGQGPRVPDRRLGQGAIGTGPECPAMYNTHHPSLPGASTGPRPLTPKPPRLAVPSL
ncbi:group II intron maturase-specific domain-containing protein [Streptomyces sp. NPDC001455]|uniref:group II intron maturase-specific domain-containing protein n=2 Tax=unclassified Streptomyces TaxID=2593676 RepID=UPI0033193235